MSDWKNIGKAKIFGSSGKYFPPDGEFRLRAVKSFSKETRKSGDAFIVDFEVLESDHDDVKVGQTYNWYQSTQDPDVAFPAIKQFVMTLFCVDEDDADMMEQFEEGLEDLMDEAGDSKWEKSTVDATEHPFNGRQILLTTYSKITQKNGKEFTVHLWKSDMDQA